MEEVENMAVILVAYFLQKDILITFARQVC